MRELTTGQEYNLATNVLNDGSERVVLPTFNGNNPAYPYTFNIEVKTYVNNQLAMDSSDSYFKIYNLTTQPSITVLSPNGGETWQNGTTQFIKWQNSATIPTFAPASYDIKLATYCGGQVCATIAPYTIVKGVTGTSYSWGVGKTIDHFGTLVSDGAYTIQVCQTGTNTCDSSDSYFKITSAPTEPSTASNIQSNLNSINVATILESVDLNVLVNLLKLIK